MRMDPLLSSRRDALEALRQAIAAGPGRVAVVIGAAGMGKSTLLRALAAGREPVAVVDAAPSLRPRDWPAHLGNVLLDPAAPLRAGAARRHLGAFLRQQHQEGRRWLLAVDEAHSLSDACLDELRIWSNQLGAPGHFAGLVLAGRPDLAWRLGPLGPSWLGRLAARIQLGPIDADEARDFLDLIAPGHGLAPDQIERHHADSGGVPALLRLAVAHLPRPALIVAAMPSAPEPWETGSLTGEQRPILIEDDSVEVGWLDEAEPPEILAALPPRLQPRPPLEPDGDLTINDPLAALQAEREWDRNRDHFARRPEVEAEADPDGEAGPPDEPTAPPTWPQHVRREGRQEFAPYSQLFSRSRPPR